MTSREPESERQRDDARAPSWRDGPHGGPAEGSPDDFDEAHPDEQPDQATDAWRANDEGPESNPDDFDEEAAETRAISKKAARPGTLHTQLQERLGDDYEVIFEAEGYQVRRAEDRAFVAEYDPDHQVLRTGVHVLFHGRGGDAREKLLKEGRERVQARMDEWKSFGFEPVDEGHIVGVDQLNSDFYRGDVPRFIQPMQKRVDSIDETAEAIEWVRKHRHSQ